MSSPNTATRDAELRELRKDLAEMKENIRKMNQKMEELEKPSKTALITDEMRIMRCELGETGTLVDPSVYSKDARTLLLSSLDTTIAKREGIKSGFEVHQHHRAGRQDIYLFYPRNL